MFLYKRQTKRVIDEMARHACNSRQRDAVGVGCD
jgi:hypothetical protein